MHCLRDVHRCGRPHWGRAEGVQPDADMVDGLKITRFCGRPIWTASKVVQSVPKAVGYIAVAVVIKTTVRGEIRTWVLSHRSQACYRLDHCRLLYNDVYVYLYSAFYRKAPQIRSDHACIYSSAAEHYHRPLAGTHFKLFTAARRYCDLGRRDVRLGECDLNLCRRFGIRQSQFDLRFAHHCC